MSATKQHHHDTIEAAQRSKERPILFSADMVRAILEGRKTQTRRVIKSKQLNENPYEWQWLGQSLEYEYFGFENKYFGAAPNELHIKNPYGQPGDRLWVRETWAEFSGIEPHVEYVYRTDGLYDTTAKEHLSGNRWRPSIHMPRAASRILLEITDIRAKRLEKIWEKINGPGSWEQNPWVWVITFKKIG